ncbi:MAG: MltA domain-containing protein [Syntrophaceae bacterium]|nr:MltA domain-containing protein [Syntrophaceae bacterium]
MKRPKYFAFIVLCLSFLFIGCTTTTVVRKDTAKPAPEITVPPQKTPTEIPDIQLPIVYRDTGIVYPLVPVDADPVSFIGDDLDSDSLVLAIGRSLQYYDRLKPGLQYRIGNTRYSVQDLKESLLLFLNIYLNATSIEERDARLRESFDVYRSVGNNGTGKIIFTGYYEPVLYGSLEKTDRYRYPIYRVPDDAVVVYLGKFLSKYRGERVIGRVENGELVPYPSRAEIDGEGCLAGKGLEIVWVDDPVELFYLHVQGSGKIILSDGSEMQVNYAQTNGRAFRGASSCLLENGKISSSQTSHQSVKRYLNEHPEELEMLYKNESYIFFRAVDAGPLGALDVPLTGGRSLAADPAVFPRGGLAFIKTRKPVLDETGNLLSWESFSRFTLLQDTGGMIKGPGRIDLFCGSGKEAEHIAGSIKEKGTLYYLVKKQSFPQQKSSKQISKTP